MYMKRQPVGALLEAWYGSNRAQAEKLRFLPPTRVLDEIMDAVAARALPPGAADFSLIQEAWPQIAGKEIAAKSEPYSLDGSKLIVEISHPAWLCHFRSPQVRKPLLEKIRKLLDKDICSDIVFVPAGRRVPGGS